MGVEDIEFEWVVSGPGNAWIMLAGDEPSDVLPMVLTSDGWRWPHDEGEAGA
jgi:hypothetical protein